MVEQQPAFTLLEGSFATPDGQPLDLAANAKVSLDSLTIRATYDAQPVEPQIATAEFITQIGHELCPTCFAMSCPIRHLVNTSRGMPREEFASKVTALPPEALTSTIDEDAGVITLVTSRIDKHKPTFKSRLVAQRKCAGPDKTDVAQSP